jgi:hydrogenase maturation protease
MNSRLAAQLPALAPAASQVLVLGIGNLLWADEGFGVRAAEALHQRWQLPENVSVVDGGTQGLYLLDQVCAAQRLLVFDAVDYQLEPGALRVFRDAEVPVWSDTMMSLHQATFQELLALAKLRGRFPEHITLIGVQPVVLDDLGGSLSPRVRARIDEAIGIAIDELAAWGVSATPRAQPGTPLCADALAIDAYEAGRPSASQACRIGDSRFMKRQPVGPG